MVVLSKIYTRTGDDGSTHLSDMSRAPKTDPRVAAYGDVDETNSVLGMALACDDLPPVIAEALSLLQNELFDLGADLSTPLVAEPEFPPLRIEQASIDRLETWCDEFSAELPTLRSFILPGGSAAAGHLHLARSVSRRAERSAWAAVQAYGTETATNTSSTTDSAPTTEHPPETDAAAAQVRPGGVNPLAVTYLNRFSDLMFVLARAVIPTSADGQRSEVLWVPGTDRPQPEKKLGTHRRRSAQSEADRSPSAAGTPVSSEEPGPTDASGSGVSPEGSDSVGRSASSESSDSSPGNTSES